MRKNISLSAPVEARANAIIKARGFDGLSDLIAALVREEYERRQPPALHETPVQYKISSERKAELADQALAILSEKPAAKKKPKTVHPK